MKSGYPIIFHTISKTYRRRLAALLLFPALMLTVLFRAAPLTAYAYPALDNSQSCSLTVSYRNADGTAFSGAKLRLYRVADTISVTEGGKHITISSMEPAFSGAGLSLSTGEDAAWSDQAEQLSAWITAKLAAAAGTGAGSADIALAASITALRTTGQTNEDGECNFQDLPQGLYYLEGDSLTQGDGVYTPAACFLTLPSYRGSDSSWDYQPTASLKYTAKRKATDPTDPTGSTGDSGSETTAAADETTSQNGGGSSGGGGSGGVIGGSAVRFDRINLSVIVIWRDGRYDNLYEYDGSTATHLLSGALVYAASSDGAGGGSGGASSSASLNGVAEGGFRALAETDGTGFPTEATVVLMQGSSIYDTRKLTPEANWRYDWYNLDSAADWKLAEIDVPEGYTAEVHREGNLFIVVNTPAGEETGAPAAAATPSAPAGGTTPSGGSGSRPADKLPQTGQLWWPVPILLGGGIFLYVLGLLLSRRERGESAGISSRLP